MDLEQIFWYLKLGRPRHKVSIFDIRQSPSEFITRPVFFLSTGRAGTKWFSSLLGKDRKLAVFHQPIPSLAMQSRKAYELQHSPGLSASEKDLRLLEEIWWSGREDYLRYTYKTGRRYVETNNYISFFAPVLNRIFPDALFVHLVRHPQAFIRSGLGRDYYLGNKSDDIKRIVPELSDADIDWAGMERAEKIAWLWKETNDFISAFLETLPEDRHRILRFHNPKAEQVQEILSFIGADIPQGTLKKMIPKKINARKPGGEHQQNNSLESNERMTRILTPTAQRLGFEI